MLDLAIRGGTLVTGSSRSRASIGVKDGKIVSFAKDDYIPDAQETVDATGLYVLPGVIDVHVHTREPGFTDLEDFSAATQAAAVGGVTTIIDMPGTDDPVLATVEAFANKVTVVHGKGHVDYALRGAILDDNLDQIAPLAAAGVVGYKLLMGSTVRAPAVGDGALYNGFVRAAEVDRPVGVHAENEGIMAALVAKFRRDRRRDPLAHFESRPDVVEAEAIQRAITLAEYAGNRLHIHHMSSKAGTEKLAEGKARGVMVTGETCPHYLLFDTGDYERLGSMIKVNPPVKTAADKEALWDGLRLGVIDILATDHAPHSEAEKIQPDIWDAVSGFAGVETLVPLMLTEVNRGRISLERFVNATSERPAQVYGLYPHKGSLGLGSDADLTVVDLDRTATIDMATLHSKARMTPFHGHQVRGLPTTTILRGRIVARDGNVVGPPTGHLLRPG